MQKKNWKDKHTRRKEISGKKKKENTKDRRLLIQKHNIHETQNEEILNKDNIRKNCYN